MGLAATLFMVDAGAMEQELRDLSKSFGMEKVVFGGFVNQAKLSKVYAVSVIFVFPSRLSHLASSSTMLCAPALRWRSPTEVACAPSTWSRTASAVTHTKAGDMGSLAIALENLLTEHYP